RTTTYDISQIASDDHTDGECQPYKHTPEWVMNTAFIGQVDRRIVNPIDMKEVLHHKSNTSNTSMTTSTDIRTVGLSPSPGPPPQIINGAINANTPNLVKPHIINGRTGAHHRHHHHNLPAYRMVEPILEDSCEELNEIKDKKCVEGTGRQTTAHHMNVAKTRHTLWDDPPVCYRTANESINESFI
ncbi:unnamed protein product, partial [Oppiella nova]